jgi:PAS domain S-box-containing protein
MGQPGFRSRKRFLAKLAQSHSLRWRLMSYLGSVWLLMLLLIGVGVVSFVYRTEVTAWRGRQGEAARNAAGTVAAFIGRAEDTLLLLDAFGHDELITQPQLVNKVLQQNTALQEVVLLDADGKVVAGASQDRPLLANLFTIPQSQWFLVARGGQPYHSSVQISSRDEPYLIVALPVSGGGVIAARLRMDVLWDVVANIRFGQTGRAYVVTRKGQIIAHTDPEVVLAQTTITESSELRPALESSASEWYGEYADLKGARVVGVAAAVPGTDWVIITELPRREAFAASRTASLLLGGGMFFLVALMMWVSARFLERVIFHPMEALRDGSERIGQGDLSHRIAVTGRDEVSQVTVAFNEMAGHLGVQRAALQRRNAELEALYQVSLGLTSNLDLDAVLDVVLDSAFKLLPGILDAHIFLYQDSRLTFAASLWADGRRNYLAAEPRPDGMTYSVARQGEPVIVPDMQTHPLYANAPAAWQGALAGIPLKIGQRVVGVMNIAYAQPHDFSEAELRLQRLLGDQIAVAIENARLYGQAQQEVAERKQAEQALRESEARYRAIVEDQTELVSRFLPDGRLTFVNQAYCRYFGKERDELIGHSFAPLIPEEDRRLTEKHIASLSRETPVATHEHRVVLPGGDIRWQQWTNRAIFDEQGRIVEFASVGRDITDRRRAEEALRRRTRQQEQLLHSARQLTATLDRNQVLTRIATSAREILDSHDCVIYLLEEDDRTLTPVIAIDPLYEKELLAMKLDVESSFTGQAVKARCALIFNDALASPVGTQIIGTPEEEDECVIAAPFMADDKVLGAMCLDRYATPFTEQDLTLAETLATYAATALKNAQTYQALQHEVEERKKIEEALRQLNEQLEERVKERTAELASANQDLQLEIAERRVAEDRLLRTANRQTLLYQILRSVSEQLEQDAIARLTVEAMVAFAGWPYICFAMPNEAGTHWVIRAVGGELAAEVGMTCPMSQGVIGRVFRTAQTQLVRDVRTDPDYKGENPVLLSELTVPIKQGARVLAVLNLESDKPAAFGAEEVQLAESLAEAIAMALENARLFEAAQAELAERRRIEAALRESEERYRLNFENVTDVVYSIDPELRLLDISPSVERHLGYPPRDLIGRPIQDLNIVAPGSLEAALSDTLRIFGGERVDSATYEFIARNGARKVGEVSGAPLVRDGQVTAIVCVARDITERVRAEEQIRVSLKEKEVLLQEIHHRVKNNLQVISSLLSLQSQRIQDASLLEMFHESQNRVRSMALIHEKLYRSPDLAQINFGEYIRELVSFLFRSYSASTRRISLKVQVDDVPLGIDSAVPCGLLLNELISNALKHAFPFPLPGSEGATPDRPNEICVEVKRGDSGHLTMSVADNGRGFPAELDFRKSGSLGLQLVNMLVEQLDGNLDLDSSHGTRVRITFPGP